jgi:hypothetical protein
MTDIPRQPMRWNPGGVGGNCGGMGALYGAQQKTTGQSTEKAEILPVVFTALYCRT